MNSEIEGPILSESVAVGCASHDQKYCEVFRMDHYQIMSGRKAPNKILIGRYSHSQEADKWRPKLLLRLLRHRVV